MSANDVDEERIAFGCPHRGHVADRPEHQTSDPEAQPQTNRGGERAVDDCDGSGRTGQENWFGQGAVDGHFKPGNKLIADCVGHQISAPPPNEKNERKKEEAANAIDRPNTI